MDRAELLSGGIFARENGQRLIQIFGRLTDRAFMGLYNKCKHDISGRYYQTGLRRVHAWSDDVLREDIHFVKESCPDMEETYEQCFNDYVRERYAGKQKTSLHCPDILEFTRRFLECVGEHEVLTSGCYFSKRNSIENKMGCIDAARQAMYTLLTTENVRVELESQISAAISTSQQQNTQKSPPASPIESPVASPVVPRRPRSEVSHVSRMSYQSTGTQTRSTKYAGNDTVNLDDDIQPDDSVSQIGNHSEVKRVYGAVEKSLQSMDERIEPVRRAASVVGQETEYKEEHDERRQGSVVSRHDFVDEEAVMVPHFNPPSSFARAPAPKLSTRDGKISSRDSSVSIGMKRIKSPLSSVR